MKVKRCMKLLNSEKAWIWGFCVMFLHFTKKKIRMDL